MDKLMHMHTEASATKDAVAQREQVNFIYSF
jgi:hypothetical protein